MGYFAELRLTRAVPFNNIPRTGDSGLQVLALADTCRQIAGVGAILLLPETLEVFRVACGSSPIKPFGYRLSSTHLSRKPSPLISYQPILVPPPGQDLWRMYIGEQRRW